MPEEMPVYGARLYRARCTESERDIHPSGTAGTGGAAGGRKAGQRCVEMRILHLVCQEMPARRHYGGSRGEKLGARCGKMCGMRYLCGVLSQKVFDVKIGNKTGAII